MPRRSYARRRTTKKPYAKRARMGRKRASPKYKSRFNSRPHGGSASSPFPATMYKVLTYCDDVELITQSVTDVPKVYDYRGNSLYDPDETGAGSQPKYYDTFIGSPGGNAPYTRYNVLASKITIDIMPDPTLASATNLMQLSVMPVRGNAGTNPYTNITDMVERPYSKTRMLGNTGAQAYTRMTYFCKTKQLFTGQNANDLDFGGNYNGSPDTGHVWRWHIGLVNVQDSQTVKCYIRVRIKYYTQFSLLNVVATS